jgi:hypothetical protein
MIVVAFDVDVTEVEHRADRQLDWVTHARVWCDPTIGPAHIIRDRYRDLDVFQVLRRRDDLGTFDLAREDERAQLALPTLQRVARAADPDEIERCWIEVDCIVSLLAASDPTVPGSSL